MQPSHIYLEGPARPQRQPCKQPRHVLCVKPIQRAPKPVVIEVLRHDPRSQQMLHGFIREELGHAIEPAIAQAEPVEHERDGRCPHAHRLPVGGVVLVEPLRDPDLATDLSDDAQMIEMLDDKAASHAPSASHPQQGGRPRAPWISPYPISSRRVNPNCGMWDLPPHSPFSVAVPPPLIA